MTLSTASSGAFDYDIAVSFAGEDRDYVNDVVKALKAENVAVFYGEDAMADMWGSNLVDFLQDVYRRRARFALIFISQHYVAKKWTNHERQSAQDRALEQASPYILPVRLDNSELPGLHSSVVHIDARRYGIAELVQFVLQRLARTEHTHSKSPTFNGRVPRTASDINNLLAMRPMAWEYLLYAAILLDENHKLDGKYQDHRIRYSRQPGRAIDDDQVTSEVSRRVTEILDIIGFFNRLLSRDVQDAAFGQTGEPGDPDRIRHIATRMCSIEEDLMDWAASVGATITSKGEAKRVFSALARYADQPVDSIRNFITNVAAQADTIHERVARGEDIDVHMIVALDIPESITADFHRALAEWNRSRRS